MQIEDAGRKPEFTLAALQKEHEQLKERVQWLETILHHMPALLYTSDNTQQTISWCNNCMETVTGFSLREMKDMGPEFFRQLLHPDDYELTGIANPLFRNNKDIAGSVARIRPKGQADWRWLVGMAVPLRRDEQGNVKEVIYAFLDLTVAIDNHVQLADAMGEVLRRQNETLLHKLTAREKDVMVLAVRGLNNKEIAEQLNLSRYTVETHRKNIRLKLKVRNTTELVTLARKAGL